MARDHFNSILRYLHLADSKSQKQKGDTGYDPLFKVRFLIDHLSAVYPQYYHPSQYRRNDGGNKVPYFFL